MTRVATIPLEAFPRKRSYRGLAWALAVLAVGLSLAYAALPWWLPRDWVKARITGELSRGLGREVSIGAVQVSWGGGLVLKDINVANSSAEQDDGREGWLARIESIRCSFRPLHMLWTEQVDFITFQRPELFLTFDERGALLLDDLGDKQGRRLPSLNYLLDDLKCHIRTPRGQSQVAMDRLECRLEPGTGVLSLLGEVLVPEPARRGARQGPRRLSLQAHVNVPRLKRDVMLNGTVELSWHRLSLRDLPLDVLPQWPIEQVAGVSTGWLALRLYPDLQVDYRLDVGLDGVRLGGAMLADVARLPDAEVQARGRWDPNADALVVRDLRYRTPGMVLAGRAEHDRPDLRFDATGATRVECHLTGQVRDWGTFLGEMPGLDQRLSACNVSLAGQGRIDLDLTRQVHQDVLRIAVEADGTAIRVGAEPDVTVDAPAGIAKQWWFEGQWDDRNPAQASTRWAVNLGRTEARGELNANRHGAGDGQPDWERVLLQGMVGSGPAGDEQGLGHDGSLLDQPERESSAAEIPCWLAALMDPAGREAGWRGINGAVELQSTSLAELFDLLPGLGRCLGKLQGNGPARLAVSLGGDSPHRFVKWQMRFEPDTTLAVRDWFDKPAGRPFELQGHISFEGGSQGRCILENLRIEQGDNGGRLSLGQGSARYALPFHSKAPEARRGGRWQTAWGQWSIALVLERVESLLALSPWLQRGLYENQCQDLAGTVKVAATGRMDARDDDLLVTQTITVDAGSLAGRWGQWLNKPTTGAFQVALDHRYERCNGRGETWLDGRVERQAGQAEVQLAWVQGEPAGAEDCLGLRRFAVRLDGTDIADWIGLSPALAASAEELELGGPLAVELDYLNTGQTQDAVVVIAADQTRFGVPTFEPSVKEVGVPAYGRWVVRRQGGHGGPAVSNWTLTEGRMRWGGLAWEALEGEFSTPCQTPADTWAGWLKPPEKALQAVRRWIRASTGSVEGDLTVELDVLHAPLPRTVRTWLRQAGLNGTASGRCRWTRAPTDESWAFDLDLASAAFMLGLDSPVATAVSKPIGDKAKLALKCAWARGRDVPADTPVDCTVALSAGANQFAGRGQVGRRAVPPDGQEPGPARTSDASWPSVFRGEGELVLADVPAWSAWLSDPCFADPSGGLEGWFGLELDQGVIKMAPRSLSFAPLAADFGGARLTLAGAVGLGPDHAATEGLHWAWGESEGLINGVLHASEKDAVRQGYVGIVLDHVDVEELLSLFNNAIDLVDRSGAPSQKPESIQPVRSLRILRDLEVPIDIYADSFAIPWSPDRLIRGDAFSGRITIQRGPVSMQFQAMVDGGVVRGEAISHTQVSEPSVQIDYVAEHVQPGELVHGFLAGIFPGLHAEGSLRLAEDFYRRLTTEPGVTVVPVGTGEFTLLGGYLEGRAVPRWMTRVFPGLDLTRFDFDYAHGWFDKQASGQVRYQMIFQGRYYNVYMIGEATPDRRFDYEVGIDFFANFDSKYWAESGQGRVPLFVTTGQADSQGRLIDERVSFTSYRRMFGTLFVSHNPLFHAYHAVRKRVLGQD